MNPKFLLSIVMHERTMHLRSFPIPQNSIPIGVIQYPHPMNFILLKFGIKVTPFWEKNTTKIREWLYAMCNVAMSVAEEQFDNRNKIIELKPDTDEAKESHFIHPSEYRRAS